MFLIDTDVLSALRQPDRHPGVVAWLSAERTSDMYLSVVSIGEVETGIALQESGNPESARVLGAWLDSVLDLYGDRILGVDRSTARRWGRLAAAVGHKGVDLLIAATAIENGLAVATGNTRHFAPTGVAVVDPFRGSS